MLKMWDYLMHSNNNKPYKFILFLFPTNIFYGNKNEFWSD